MSTLFLVDNILTNTKISKGDALLEESLKYTDELDVNPDSPISSSSNCSSYLVQEKPLLVDNNISFYKMIEDSNINISDCSDSDDEKKKQEICCICRNSDDDTHKIGYFDFEKKYICDQCYTRSDNQSDKLSPIKMSPSHFLNSEDAKLTILSETRNVKPILKFSVSAILGDNKEQTEYVNKRNGKKLEYIYFSTFKTIF